MRAAPTDPSTAPAPARSMLKRLFDRQLLRISPAERLPSAAAAVEKDEAEPSSVCLDGMVRSFLEDGVGAGAEKAGHGGRYCNCFHGGDNSDDEEDEEAAAAAADAARASLKKRGLHLPPWRKPEYMRAKWLSRYEREAPAAEDAAAAVEADGEGGTAA